MRDYLNPYLKDDLKTCAQKVKDTSNETVVLHLRGTDLVTNNDWNDKVYFSHCHVQPSCDYYDDAITRIRAKMKFKRIYIATDGNNTCEQHIKLQYNSNRYPELEVRTSETSNHAHKEKHHREKSSQKEAWLFPASTGSALFQDACMLLGARNIVSSRSTFSAMFLLANPFRDQVAIPLASPENHMQKPDFFESFEYCDVWNMNQGLCPYVTEGYFYYPRRWNEKTHEVDTFAATCHDKSDKLGSEPT
jgi:hypothetical protein